MKKILTIALGLLLIVSIAGCSNNQTTGGGDAPKKVLIEAKNVSDSPWVICMGTVKDPEVDWHYIMIENFTIEPGESDTTHLFGEELNGHKDLGYFTETSNSTYELKLIVSETPIPTDPEILEDGQTDEYNDHLVDISGKYNEYAVIEWDGSVFKQVK